MGTEWGTKFSTSASPSSKTTPAIERLPAIREHDDITRLDVRGRVLEESEVVAGGVVEAVRRHWS